jgi:pimeloyl-ACP methyl ester carboxylesterase
VIVEIPGTKDWNVSQLTDPDVTNAGTNLRALAGERTTYEKGVIAALDAAGVRNDDDITLIGHSLGGVIAVNTARDLTARGRNVSHVITAGAPISSVARHLPSSVQVLAVENQGDIVPHLDGSPNPDRATLTTVTVHHDHRNVTANHDLDKSYLPGAADIDASDDPSVRAYLDGLAAQLGAGSVTAHSYVVTRTH